MPETLRIGTRGSRLALWQADEVARRLAAARPGLRTERVVLKTPGDRILDTPLSRIGDKGLFTKDVEVALLEGRVDLAVHSLKDLPTKLPPGLALAAVLEREDPRDVLVSPSGRPLAELPAGARLGTSSLRRRAQLLALRRDLRIEDLRGNVPTRIAKAQGGEYDGVVLARAGVVRLGLAGKITEVFAPERLLPAVGQGAIAVEARAGDATTAGLLFGLDHRPTRLAVEAERAFLGRLAGGCQAPIGALGTLSGARLRLVGMVADLDGSTVVRGAEEGDATTEPEARALGEHLAECLLERGARDLLARILAAVRGAPAVEPSGGGEGD